MKLLRSHIGSILIECGKLQKNNAKARSIYLQFIYCVFDEEHLNTLIIRGY